MEQKIQLKHPTGKKAISMDKEKYSVIEKSLLTCLKGKSEATHKEILNVITEDFKKKQQQAINDHAAKANVVICTAQIPGRKAPLLIPTVAVEAMKPGSVIIDLAASSGGNCELSKDEETVAGFIEKQLSLTEHSIKFSKL